MYAGRTRPIKEFDREFRERHGLPNQPWTYRIRVSDQAEADIERLYFSTRSLHGEVAAQRWYDTYSMATRRLLASPFSRGLAYENPRFAEELRHLLFRNPEADRPEEDDRP